MDYLENLPKPLVVSREQLIAALQEKLDEETQEREQAEQALQESEQALRDAVAAFDIDELVEIFRSYFTTDVEKLTKHKQQKTYVPEKTKPSVTETDLARAVRVLGMSTDESVELKPNTDLYRLL